MKKEKNQKERMYKNSFRFIKANDKDYYCNRTTTKYRKGGKTTTRIRTKSTNRETQKY